MIKSIIFSGPQGSGKSYMANAMAWAQDYKKSSFTQTANEIGEIKDRKKTAQLLQDHSLIIIDECTEKNISDFNDVFSNIITDGKCTILYLTQDKVSKLPGQNFWLINLNEYKSTV